MADSTETRVSGLLQQGLEFYGTGDVARAFLLWREALELDPGNEEALDYMRDADRRSKPRGGAEAEIAGSVIEDVRRLLQDQNAESAYELITSVGTGDDLESEAMVELLRATLYSGYRKDLGSLGQVPRIVGEAAKSLESRNLPPTAGFLLSMVDGMTPLADLISLSGMDRFEALRSVCRMREAKILEWDE
ncbi:MAG: hypothetical protein AB8G23_00300 [Myxococcota bacterium]